MNHNTPKDKPAQLLSDLESIRQLLEPATAEPPLLTEAIDPQNIPLLSDIVAPPQALAPTDTPPVPGMAQDSAAPTLPLDRELRIAAQLLVQEVINDFMPQIEVELIHRLQGRLDALIKQRKP